MHAGGNDYARRGGRQARAPVGKRACMRAGKLGRAQARKRKFGHHREQSPAGPSVCARMREPERARMGARTGARAGLRAGAGAGARARASGIAGAYAGAWAGASSRLCRRLEPAAR